MNLNNNRSPLVLTLIGLITAGFVTAFWPVFERLIIRWDSGDNNYCYLIVPLFVYLCWDQHRNDRNGFHLGAFAWSAWGLVGIIFGIGLMVLGELGSVETFQYGGLWISMVALVILFYGRNARLLAFPLTILAFIVPLPPFINRMLTFELRMYASTLAAKMLRLANVSVHQTGNIIDLGIEKLQVVDACSGLRYLMPLILMALIVGYFFNQRVWQRIVLLVIVAPLSIVVNAFRVFLSGWLTVNGHRELAQSFFHDFSGWAVFMIAGAIMLLTAMMIARIGASPPQVPPAERRPTVKTSQRRALALSAAVCILFGFSAFALRLTPTAANLPARARLEGFPMQIAQWQGHQQYLSKEIMAELWADDYVSAVYRTPTMGNRIQLFIPFYEYQGTRHTAHAPQACLMGGGFDLLKTEDRLLQTANGQSIKVRILHLKQGSRKILASYFFFERGRVITSPWKNKFYLFWDALTKGRTDGALVRAELLMTPDQAEEEAFAILSDFIEEIWVLLPDYVPT